MECVKLLASFFVVFIHAPFPLTFGSFVECLARFAVPLFFAISGYFSYQISPSAVARRLKRMFLLLLWGTLLYCFGCYVAIECVGGSTISYLRRLIPNWQDLARFVLLSNHFISEPLWYLVASFQCYLVFWVYSRFFQDSVDYKPLYISGFFLFLVYLSLSVLGNAAELYLPIIYYRNWLLLGLPMFTMGLFLRQYHAHILSQYQLTSKKLVLLFLLGLSLSILEWLGTGPSEMHLGTVVEVIALLLLCVQNPCISIRFSGIIHHFGNISTNIYLFHFLILHIYIHYFQDTMILTFGDTVESWIMPLVILLVSLLSAILAEMLRCLVRFLDVKKECRP